MSLGVRGVREELEREGSTKRERGAREQLEREGSRRAIRGMQEHACVWAVQSKRVRVENIHEGSQIVCLHNSRRICNICMDSLFSRQHLEPVPPTQCIAGLPWEEIRAS